MNAKQTVKDICELEEKKDVAFVDIRTKVLEQGKKLCQLQKWQKAEQKTAKKRGEDPQTWRDWVEEQKRSSRSFPSEADCRRYIRISQYPRAYAPGMSVIEAYRAATLWKKNGGNPPPKTKLTIKNRYLAQLGKYLNQAEKRLEKCNAVEDWTTIRDAEEWSDDEVAGIKDMLVLTQQQIDVALQRILAAAEKEEEAVSANG